MTLIKPILVAVFCGIASFSTAQVKTTNIGHPQNLQVTHTLKCLRLNQVRPKYTPADLSRAIVACANAQRFEDAIALHFALSGYARFDTKKTSDPSARVALGMLNQQMLGSISAQGRVGMQEASARISKKEGPFYTDVCQGIKALKHPTYQPVYMAAHGLKAFDTSDGKMSFVSAAILVGRRKVIDEDQVWADYLNSWGAC